MNIHYRFPIARLFAATALAIFLSAASVQTPSLPGLTQVIHRIEGRQGLWTSYHASMDLQFISFANHSGSCSGELFYHRLSERILLQCYNDQNQLLFGFKTEDRYFELYFPSKKALYRGDIFDLHYSEDIESHLQPIYLYRALKIDAIPEDRAELIEWDDSRVVLNISGLIHGRSYIARQIIATHEGDVTSEFFFDPVRGDPEVAIHRQRFRNLEKKESGIKKPVRFPEEIHIRKMAARPDADADTETTVIRFKNITFSLDSGLESWNFPIPEGTEIRTI